MTQNTGPSSIVLRTPTTADADFEILTTLIPTNVVPGTTSQVTNKDAIFERQTNAAYDPEYQVDLVDLVAGTLNVPVVVKSETPNVATIDQTGRTTRVGDGFAQFSFHHPWLTRRRTLNHTHVPSGTIESLTGWVEGSMAHALSAAINTRIDGADPSTAMPTWITRNPGSGTYQRNTACWAADLDLTGISASNSRSGILRNAVLVSPLDAICARHFGLATGDVVRYVSADNAVVSRTIVKVTDIADTDIRVVTFDRDLPPAIGFYKLLPDGWDDYLPNLTLGVPGLRMDRHHRAGIANVRVLNTAVALFWEPTDATHAKYFHFLEVNDSSSPGFFVVGDELVLLTQWTFGGAGKGPNFAAYKSQINAAMTANGSSYQLTEVDLSGFTNFG